jgi:purine-cytosine permease-like protein
VISSGNLPRPSDHAHPSSGSLPLYARETSALAVSAAAIGAQGGGYPALAVLERIFKRSRNDAGETKPERDSISEDDVHSQVPAHARRGPFTMGLLWITMVTGLPCIIMGFEWHKQGLSLAQIVVSTFLSSLMLLAYLVPSALLGAFSGRSFISLSKMVFGRVGVYLVSANIIWVMMGWYGVMSLLLADGLTGIFHWAIPLGVGAFICAIAMSSNNLFGFKGVANFARYFAAPLIVGWVLFTFFKAVIHPSTATAIQASSHVSNWTSITTISSFVLGFAVWGNEPDYWRFAKPKIAHSVWPLAISVGLGQMIFPVTGWLMAHATGITDGAAATSFVNDYSFGGMTWLVATVLIATYFAPTDSGLYGLTAAITSHFKFHHKLTVIALALLAGALAYGLAASGSAHALQSMCELNAIVLPPAVVVMLVEWFMQRKVWHMSAFFDQTWEELPKIRWTAIVAVLAGIFTGLLTSGMLPGCAAFHWGIPPLQAWIATALVYGVLNILSPGVRTTQFE